MAAVDEQDIIVGEMTRMSFSERQCLYPGSQFNCRVIREEMA